MWSDFINSKLFDFIKEATTIIAMIFVLGAVSLYISNMFGWITFDQNTDIWSLVVASFVVGAIILIVTIGTVLFIVLLVVGTPHVFNLIVSLPGRVKKYLKSVEERVDD